MNSGVTLEESMVSDLITVLERLKIEAPTKAVVVEKARLLAEANEFPGRLEPVVSTVLTRVNTRMLRGTSLIEPVSEHDRGWVDACPADQWHYTDAYSEYLCQRGWTSHMADALRVSGMELLGLLNDPTVKGRWDRRGLVVGNVQSGKTANYIGLATLAADAGYRVIIIVSGIQNELRSQTQQRVDEGLIGYTHRDGQRKNVGVGEKRNHDRFPVTLTTIDRDFRLSTAQTVSIAVRTLNTPLVLVIKKNVTVLEHLREWFASHNAQPGHPIESVPLLFIDDEADHASVNTNKPELDPTRTNRLIRDILRLFGQSSFVGYTATPFANIFINPDAYDSEVREDLFPRHFIHALRAPSAYFGPDKIFPTDNGRSSWVRDIDDCEDVLPLNHKKDCCVTALPNSLKEALALFLVSRAVRNVQGYERQHHSMMVNVSRFVAVQAQVRELVADHVACMQQAIQANYALSDHHALQDPIMRDLRAAMIRHYPDCEVGWTEVKRNLQRAAAGAAVLMINSASTDTLDFTTTEKGGRTVIAVGGFSLSRGLTLEGLCISYLYRSTRTYDTLMQMGRWFGYRIGFEDLCRIYLRETTRRWYQYIAEASEELVRQLERMNLLRKSPSDFGLYVRAHPGSLVITSRGKMQEGKKVRQTYAGLIRRCTRFSDDEEVHRKNENLIRTFWESPVDGVTEETKKGWIIRNVGLRTIGRFIERFELHADMSAHKDLTLQYLYHIERIHPCGDVLLISPRNRGGVAQPLRLGYQARTLEVFGSGWRARKDIVASRGDEGLGLSEEQLKRARQAAIVNSKGDRREPIDSEFRAQRNKPLLMIHVIRNKNTKGRGQRIPSFDVSFPDDYRESIEVVLNHVMQAQQLELPFDGYAESEEDE